MSQFPRTEQLTKFIHILAHIAGKNRERTSDMRHLRADTFGIFPPSIMAKLCQLHGLIVHEREHFHRKNRNGCDIGNSSEVLLRIGKQILHGEPFRNFGVSPLELVGTFARVI